ncbi:hypothetical protein BIW11_10105 [Tropilaelaps mercedesae]|uniref:Secreted protein n=1 Tax=Tropilaelaps mercedesae TaxID=418985 RepID=A0A1V9XHH0_9ACAR|nr:hypothetical protein BIW11_10105 [Tropilaelaps mercedesae]
MLMLVSQMKLSLWVRQLLIIVILDTSFLDHRQGNAQKMRPGYLRGYLFVVSERKPRQINASILWFIHIQTRYDNGSYTNVPKNMINNVQSLITLLINN